jgi:glucosamine-6-phosphate deaminase
MTPDHRTPAFNLIAPEPLHQLDAGNARIYVYPDAEQMGLATAINIAAHQLRLFEDKGSCSIMIMAAPSAFSFYRSYQNVVFSSPALQKALYETHLFQFDDYALPVHHPVSFRFLLMEHFLAPIARFCDSRKVHLFQADVSDTEKACREYGQAILEAGPDLQIKGVGEDGHWGFHEPGIPLDGEPKFMRVKLAEANVAQQMRDHPKLFPTADRVPRYAYTANVPLFLRTRVLIEDNVPQPSKAFAVLAAYGNGVVKDRVPSSALKGQASAVIRLTAVSAWALLEYRQSGVVSSEMLRRLDASLSGSEEREIGQSVDVIRRTLTEMEITCAG